MVQPEEKPVPPVKVGEEHKAYLSGFGKNGDPFVKVSKYVLFLRGDKGRVEKIDPKAMVRFKVTKVLPKFGFAKMLGEEKEEEEDEQDV